MSACDPCLRRATLLARLAGWIERVLDERRPIAALLALCDDDLIAAVCGQERAPIDAAMDAFDPSAARTAANVAELRTVCQHAGSYPPLLRQAPDRPAALFMRGREDVLAALIESPAVAVVGSRQASSYGLEVAQALARDLAACGVPVVSGMAFGIDSAAHEGALAVGGPTVAVMPGGADLSYPRSKHALHRRIAERGLVVSELPSGTTPFRWCFPARNRIMAALTRMTIVVEGKERSGSLITARFAQDLGRDVGAVPGHVTAAVAACPNALLADGACVVRSAQDVLDAIHGPGVRSVTDERRAAASVEPRLEQLLAAVERGETIESLAAGGTGVGAVLAGLTELELLGLVRRGPGGSYVRCA